MIYKKSTIRYVKLILLSLLIAMLAFTTVLYNLDKKRFSVSANVNGMEVQIGTQVKNSNAAVNPKIFGIDNNNNNFKITADSAEEGANRAEMKNIKASIYFTNDAPSLIFSGKGEIFFDKEEAALKEKVEIFFEDRYKIYTDAMHIFYKQGRAIGKSEINMKSDFGFMSASGFEVEYSKENEKLHLIGPVKANINLTSKK